MSVYGTMPLLQEFDLGKLREKIIEQLTASPQELAKVSSSLEIMKHPRILQDLLVHMASSVSHTGRNAKDEEKDRQLGAAYTTHTPLILECLLALVYYKTGTEQKCPCSSH